MNNTANRRVLVLGATGKTGSRVASKLSGQGVSVRTAARGGADIHFDWNNPATFEGALQGVTGVYLVSPVMRVDFAGVVSDFLDQAEHAGSNHLPPRVQHGARPGQAPLPAVTRPPPPPLPPPPPPPPSRGNRRGAGQLRRLRRQDRSGVEVEVAS